MAGDRRSIIGQLALSFENDFRAVAEQMGASSEQGTEARDVVAFAASRLVERVGDKESRRLVFRSQGALSPLADHCRSSLAAEIVDREAVAPDLSKSGAITRNDVADVTPTAGGIDTLFLNVYGEWNPAKFAALAQRLEVARENAAEGERASFVELAPGEFGQLNASGAKRGVYYRWVIHWEGNRLLVLSRPENRKHPLCVLQLGSVFLTRYGERNAVDVALALLESLGLRVTLAQPGLVDFCVDLAGVDVNEFVAPMLSGYYVTRSDDWQPFNRKRSWTGFQVGGQRVLLRVYDKLLEVSSDLIKRELLRRLRWGGTLPDKATRVEFSISREVLRERFGVTSWADLQSKTGAILEWCVGEWFRLTDRAPDRKGRNQDKALVHPLWLAVRERFASICRWVDQVAAVGPQVVQPKIERLVRQAAGCLGTALAVLGDLTTVPDEVAKVVSGLLSPIAFLISSTAESKRAALVARGVTLPAFDVPF